MSILAQLTETRHDLVINVAGDFVLSLQDEFKQAYRDSTVPGKRYVIDMQQVDYLDSSALDMLLELREYARRNTCEVCIVNMKDAVLEIFHVLRFHKVFKPHYDPKLRRIIWQSLPD